MTTLSSYVHCCLVAAAVGVFGTARASAQTPEQTPEAQSPSNPDSGGAPSETSNALRLKQARELFIKGTQEFKSGNNDEAIEAFLLADELVPSAALSFNVARVYDATGNAGQSIYWFMDYLRRAPDAPDAEEVRVKVAELDASLVRDGKQLVMVRCESDAEVYLGDEHLGACPLGVAVDLGAASFRLVDAKGRELLREIAVDPTRVALIEASWAAEATQPPAPAKLEKQETLQTRQEPNLAVVPPPTSTPARQPVLVAHEEPAYSDNILRPAGLVVMVGGVLGLGAASAFELVRRDAEADAGRSEVQVQRQAAMNSMSDWMVAARVSAAVGGGLLLAGGVLWLLGGPEPRSAGDVSIGVAPDPALGSPGLRLTGSY